MYADTHFYREVKLFMALIISMKIYIATTYQLRVMKRKKERKRKGEEILKTLPYLLHLFPQVRNWSRDSLAYVLLKSCCLRSSRGAFNRVDKHACKHPGRIVQQAVGQR